MSMFPSSLVVRWPGRCSVKYEVAHIRDAESFVAGRVQPERDRLRARAQVQQLLRLDRFVHVLSGADHRNYADQLVLEVEDRRADRRDPELRLVHGDFVELLANVRETLAQRHRVGHRARRELRQLAGKHATLKLGRRERERKPPLRGGVRGQAIAELHRDHHRIGKLPRRADDRVAARWYAEDDRLPGKVAQLHGVRFGKTAQIELLHRSLPDMRELEAELVALGLRVLLDEAEMLQRREVAMHPRLRLAEMIGERSQTHRLVRGRERFKDLSGHHHGLDEAASVGAVLVWCQIEDIRHLAPFSIQLYRCAIFICWGYASKAHPATSIAQRLLTAAASTSNIANTMYRNKKHQ